MLFYSDSWEVYDYSVMVTGVTGSGKSTFCNFICAEEVFKTNDGFASVTTKTGAITKSLLGKKVRLIDTPGFCDEFETNEEHMKELGQAIFLARNGINAVGFTISASGRFTKNEAKTIQEMSKCKEIWPFTFVIFTNAGDLGDDEEQQKLQIQENLASERCPKSLHDLLKCTGNRYILVESIEPSKNQQAYYHQKVRELLHMIYKIYDLNDHKLYTNELFVKASKLVAQAKHQKATTIEQTATATVEVRMRKMNRSEEKCKRESFESTWWAIERKRRSLIDKVNSKESEAIATARKVRQEAIEKAELDYKQAVAKAEKEAENQTKIAKEQEAKEKKQAIEQRDKDIYEQETIKKHNSIKLKQDVLKEIESSVEEDACDVALQKLKEELKQVRLQNKELMKQRDNNWYSLLSQKMTGKECTIQ